MCIHKTPDGLCRKYSDDTCTSYCVEGPCPYDTPTNADHIRAVSDEELAEFAIMSSKFFCTRKEPAPCEKPMSCTECALDWLRQPWEEETDETCRQIQALQPPLLQLRALRRLARRKMSLELCRETLLELLQILPLERG